MSNPARPRAAPAMKRLWSSRTTILAGAVAFSTSSDRVAVGAGNSRTDSSAGSLTIYDAQTGAIVRQAADDWQVFSLAISADGRWLATAEVRWLRTAPHAPLLQEGRARVLNVESGAERCRYSGDLIPGQVTFSPDGVWVVVWGETRSAERRVWVFDASNGTPGWVREIVVEATLVACSPDGTSIAFGHDGGVTVLDSRTGADRALAPSSSAVQVLAYSPDSRRIVGGCVDGTICVFDGSTGSQVWTARLPTEGGPGVYSVAVSDDGRWVVGLWAGFHVGVYDLSLGTPRFPPLSIFGGTRVSYSPTLRHIIVNARNTSPSSGLTPFPLTVIDARTGLEDRDLERQRIWVIATAPDGCSVLVSGRESDGSATFLEMYDLGVEVSRYGVDAGVTSISLSPGGAPLVAVADTNSAVTVFTADNGARLARKPIPGTIASMTFADSGQAVAAGGADGVWLFSIVGDRSWRVRDIGRVNGLAALLPAGDWIAVAAGRAVWLYRSTDGHAGWPSPSTHPQTVTRIASSHDGKWIATGCADRQTRILDARTGAQTPCVEADGKVRAVVFQPNGSLLATGNEDGTVFLIDATTASIRGKVTHPVACSHIALSFDATMLAVAWDDNTVHIFDLATGGSPPVKLRELGYRRPVSQLAFNPIDNSLAVATAAASIAVHDPHSGIELTRILHPNPAWSFAFSADGVLIATTSDDNIVRVWATGT